MRPQRINVESEIAFLSAKSLAKNGCPAEILFLLLAGRRVLFRFETWIRLLGDVTMKSYAAMRGPDQNLCDHLLPSECGLAEMKTDLTFQCSGLSPRICSHLVFTQKLSELCAGERWLTWVVLFWSN